MRDGGVVTAAGAEVHDMPHAGLARAIEKHLALPQHVHRVASGQKYALDAGQRRCQRLFPIKIELDGADTQFFEGRRLGGRAHGGNRLDLCLGL